MLLREIDHPGVGIDILRLSTKRKIVWNNLLGTATSVS